MSDLEASPLEVARKKRKLEFLQDLSRTAHSATCDFEIVCGEEVYKVHRLVLSMHSAYFKRLCESSFSESSFKESSERKIYLQEDPPLAVRVMVAYCYDFEYESTFVESDFQPNGALNNDYEAYAQVFTIADKYDIPGLKDKVLEDF